MAKPNPESWLRTVRTARGHNHLYEPADELLTLLRSQELPESASQELFARIVAVLATEVEISVRTASHPGATMESYHFFRSLEVTGDDYRVSGGWAMYLNRIFDLLHQFHAVLFAERGRMARSLESGIAASLASPLYEIRGSALRGPSFSVRIDANLTRLCSILETVGYFVPRKDVEMFSDVRGPSEGSIFAIEDDAHFRALLTGAARSRDPNARRMLTYFLDDDEGWVASLAGTLLSAYFREGGE
jgi:hypothetical protein